MSSRVGYKGLESLRIGDKIYYFAGTGGHHVEARVTVSRKPGMTGVHVRVDTILSKGELSPRVEGEEIIAGALELYYILEPFFECYKREQIISDKQVTVEVECSDCEGTGIYHGLAEPKGVGVICLSCRGSGKKLLKYTPFTERKKKINICTVRLSRGSLIATGVGPTGGEITYQEFLEGKFPKQS